MSKSGPPKPSLDKQKHITYWKRCLKTYLPYQYTSMDANRMMLAYFTLFSLDILDALDTTVSADERENCLSWIYLCQHPQGGFRGSPGVDLDGREETSDKSWDVASVPATFFALSMLAMLKDDFARVRRKECLEWLRRMQRKDGSFGEYLDGNGNVEGGMDTRFGFCAAGVRWMLRGEAVGDVDGVPDVDVDALIECIRRAQTFDGGISEMAFHEPHGGYTYCALAALALMGGLPKEIQNQHQKTSSTQRPTGLTNIEHTTRWLLSRQTSDSDLLDDNDGEEDDDEIDDDEEGEANHIPYAGFNGRCNKPADTCYAFWIEGSLSLLNRLHLCSQPLSRAYLLMKTQHVIGGFGKTAGDPPDIFHSALGLAALALMDEPGLKQIDAALCLSTDACGWVEELAWRRVG